MVTHMYNMLFEAGKHDWKKVSETAYTDYEGKIEKKYHVHKCSSCGVVGRKYEGGSSIYIGHQYDRDLVINCGTVAPLPTRPALQRKKKPALMRRKKPALMRRR